MLVVLTLVALLLMAYGLVCSAIAHRFTTTRRKPPAAVAGARTVHFPSRDGRARIAAWYRRPGHCTAAVVFVHGKDTCRGEELRTGCGPLAEALAAAGIALLRIDLRGHGSSSAGRLTYGQAERHDVLGAVDWLRAQGHRRIGVLGASMGAASALLAAAEEPAIAALVADSPFADFGTMIERQYAQQCRLPAWFLPGALAVARVLTGVDLLRLRPLAVAPALQGRPVLVIHSEGDRFIPAADGRAIASAAGAALWATPTAGHVGSYRALPAAYTAKVLGFFRQHLCDADAAAESGSLVEEHGRCREPLSKPTRSTWAWGRPPARSRPSRAWTGIKPTARATRPMASKAAW